MADEIAQICKIQTGISNRTKYFTEFFSNGTSFLIATTQMHEKVKRFV